MSRLDALTVGEDEGTELRDLEYLHGLQDGLMLGKDCVRRWMRDKKDPEQLFLEFVHFMERVEERKVVMVEASMYSEMTYDTRFRRSVNGHLS